MKKRIGNIGHSAHFGGAVGGYVTTLLIKPELFEMHPILLGLLALPIIALFVMDRMGKI
jgi:membrane associated rhomboid family serine protease